LVAVLLLVVTILAAALAWSAYFYLMDLYDEEPRHLLLVVFLAGAAMTLPAWLAYGALERLGIGAEAALIPESGAWARLGYCVLVVGVIEELCKFLAVQVLIGRHRAFDEHLDGIVYAAFGGLGFASMENLVLGPWLEGPELWGRLIVSPLVHALFASIWGWALSLDKFARPRRLGRVTLGLLLAILVHGLYDFLVLTPGTWPRLLAAGLILALWIAFFVVIAYELKRSPHRPASA